MISEHRTTPEAQHLDPRIRTVWRVASLVAVGVVSLLAIAGGVGVIVADAAPPLVVGPVVGGAVVVAGAVAWWWPGVRYRHWTYRMGEDALELFHGALFRTESVIPYFRVQHVDTSQGPIERRLGLANLTVHTASAATDASLPGLAADDAESIRRRMLAQVGDGDAV